MRAGWGAVMRMSAPIQRAAAGCMTPRADGALDEAPDGPPVARVGFVVGLVGGFVDGFARAADLVAREGLTRV